MVGIIYLPSTTRTKDWTNFPMREERGKESTPQSEERILLTS